VVFDSFSSFFFAFSRFFSFFSAFEEIVKIFFPLYMPHSIHTWCGRVGLVQVVHVRSDRPRSAKWLARRRLDDFVRRLDGRPIGRNNSSCVYTVPDDSVFDKRAYEKVISAI